MLEQAGVPLESVLDVAGDYRFDGGYAATAAMVDNGATAVFCCNDLMAMGLDNIQILGCVGADREALLSGELPPVSCALVRVLTPWETDPGVTKRRVCPCREDAEPEKLGRQYNDETKG